MNVMSAWLSLVGKQLEERRLLADQFKALGWFTLPNVKGTNKLYSPQILQAFERGEVDFTNDGLPTTVGWQGHYINLDL
jgi:hypothetical protein